jgi:hypothetical protein
LDQQFPFSHDGRRQPHPSSLTSNTSASTKNDALARQLGSFSSASLANPLSPGLSHPYNPLTHWGGVGLRNPYAPYGAARSATKATGSAKDTNNPRKKSYEDKMDKQRLEHILFSGDNLTGALNQTKERMRQKLQKKNQNKKGKTNKSKHKKTQSLPNGSNTAHSLLQLDAAKQQKPKRDNGYFLTSISSKPGANSQNQNQNQNNANPKKKTRGNPKGRGNPKRGNPKKGRPKPKNNNPKK